MSSFKTYVDITEHSNEDYEWINSDEDHPKLEPCLLPGEVVVAYASNVLKFASVSNRKHGISGCLYVTNFKIAFVSTTSNYAGNPKDERNKLLSQNEVCLANIDQVYQVNGERRKKLLPGTSIITNVKTIQLVCKDFSVHSYSFKFCPVGFHKTVINAILHHSFPKRIELLFSFECMLPPTQTVHEMQFFTNRQDWESEVERCHCNEGWRVCSANENYQLSASLPQGFVVPRSLSDNQILKASKHFMGNRPPVWCWGHINKCVIVRMAVLHNFITDTQQESIMLEHVRKSHPNLREPLILELDKSMPTLAEIHASWCKLRDSSCCPLDNIQKFWEQDSRSLSLLNGSRWPHHVMICLRMANRVVEAVSQHQVSVVLQESESRDLSAVISSLAQLIMDPHFRTINGFQSLVQKEWVTLGHAFTKRFGRISEYENQQSPLFQLFLDCVWQMQHQFPMSFEFSETYLTSLWDSLHNTVFDTFSFDSDRIRYLMTQPQQQPDGEGSPAVLISRSVWDWSSQFHDVDIGLFLNPLFSITCRVAAYRQRRGISPANYHNQNNQLVRRWIHGSSSHNDGGGRPRRNSISGSLSALRASEYGAAEQQNRKTDTLGRSWGSRFGLAALPEHGNAVGTLSRASSNDGGSGAGGTSSRWKRIRGALFHNHGRSFSPHQQQISSIEEGMEMPLMSSSHHESPAVTYRASRGIVDLGQHPQTQQRWTVYGAAVYDPIPSYNVKLQPTAKPLKLDLGKDWDDFIPGNDSGSGGADIPYHELDWPVYSMLPVADSFVDFRLWSQCYLRWIPVLDVRGGGHPPIYFHHCALVNDILSLESQLDKLHHCQLQQGMSNNGEADMPSSPSQRFVTMSDQSPGQSGNQVTLSSFHPFVQQQNDSALSFGEWEIVPSPVISGSALRSAGGRAVEAEFDSDSFVAD